jgi:hypothetical protein
MDDSAPNMNGTGSKTRQVFHSFGKFCMNEHGLFVSQGRKEQGS